MTHVQGTRPTIMFVHGGCHGSWCWERLSAAMAGDGWHCVSVDLPTAISSDPPPDPLPDMYDDAEYLVDQLRRLTGPVVVVAHSYGGVPTTQAIADAPNVAHVVYLAAVPLDVGENMYGYFDMPWAEPTETLVRPHAGAKEMFFNDLPDAEADAAFRCLVPHSAAAGYGVVTMAGWRTIPSSYIVCERDQTMEPWQQDKIAARAGSTIYRIDTSHSPFLSRPAELAGLLTGIAAAA